jgi:hypothetical protein
VTLALTLEQAGHDMVQGASLDDSRQWIMTVSGIITAIWWAP